MSPMGVNLNDWWTQFAPRNAGGFSPSNPPFKTLAGMLVAKCQGHDGKAKNENHPCGLYHRFFASVLLRKRPSR